MLGKYRLLEDHTVVLVEDVRDWGREFEISDRRVARETVCGCDVSTVFLGLDHRFGASGPPLVFETMVFGGLLDGETRRYSTWRAAITGHAHMVVAVQRAMGNET